MIAQPPKISVIITCYNYEEYVSSAIDSVLSQSYSEKEVIVVDDASTDTSRAIINSYGTSVISVLKDINGGHGAAFNFGFDKSSGSIVMFLDADDFLLPNALKRIAESFQTKDDATFSMVQYRMELVDSAARAYDIFPKLEQAFHTGDQKSRLLKSGTIETTVTSGLAFSRTFLEQVMPIPAEDFHQGSDGYLATLAALYAPLGDGGTAPISAYRQHGKNHSGFEAQIEKRAAWVIAHREACYSALRTHAIALGENVSHKLGQDDESYLTQKMAIRLFTANLPYVDSRLRLSFSGASAVQKASLSLTNRMALTVWWFLLGILPVAMAKHILAWRLQAASRPEWVQKLAKRLRRL